MSGTAPAALAGLSREEKLALLARLSRARSLPPGTAADAAGREEPSGRCGWAAPWIGRRSPAPWRSWRGGIRPCARASRWPTASPGSWSSRSCPAERRAPRWRISRACRRRGSRRRLPRWRPRSRGGRSISRAGRSIASGCCGWEARITLSCSRSTTSSATAGPSACCCASWRSSTEPSPPASQRPCRRRAPASGISPAGSASGCKGRRWPRSWPSGANGWKARRRCSSCRPTTPGVTSPRRAATSSPARSPGPRPRPS